MMTLVLIVERRIPNGKRGIPVVCAELTNYRNLWCRMSLCYGTLQEAVAIMSKASERYWLEGRNYT